MAVKHLMVVCAVAFFILTVVPVHGWTEGHATFYGGSDASGTLGGACGYGDMCRAGYGTNTAALSSALFKNGAVCGACYQISCDVTKVPQWCLPGTSITITATDFCPPNNALPNDNGGWCNLPLQNFVMAQPAFVQIANYSARIVPVVYKRVGCKRTGGITFSINGEDPIELVLISNVGGTGVINAAWIKGSNTGWQQMTRNLGPEWKIKSHLTGQSLSFKLMSSDSTYLTMYHVAPSNWRFGQTFSSSQNF